MELTEQQKNCARLFIQQFPHMTFAKAKKAFDNIQKPVQNEIRKKAKKHDTMLHIALGLIHLSPELQHKILMPYNTVPIDADKIMNKRSISEYLACSAITHEKFKNSDANVLTIDTVQYRHSTVYYDETYYREAHHYCMGKEVSNSEVNVKIQLTPAELFELGCDVIKVLEKIETCQYWTHYHEANCLSPQELVHFKNLPDKILNQRSG